MRQHRAGEESTLVDSSSLEEPLLGNGPSPIEVDLGYDDHRRPPSVGSYQSVFLKIYPNHMDCYRDGRHGSHATARYIGCQLGTSLFVTLSHVDDGRCWWLGLFVNGHLWLVLCLGTSHSSRLAGSCGHLFGSMQTTGHSLDHAGQFHWGLLFVKSLCDCDFHGANAHAIDCRYHYTKQSV